jgi:hypothetical protein
MPPATGEMEAAEVGDGGAESSKDATTDCTETAVSRDLLPDWATLRRRKEDDAGPDPNPAPERLGYVFRACEDDRSARAGERIRRGYDTIRHRTGEETSQNHL